MELVLFKGKKKKKNSIKNIKFKYLLKSNFNVELTVHRVFYLVTVTETEGENDISGSNANETEKIRFHSNISLFSAVLSEPNGRPQTTGSNAKSRWPFKN